MGTNKTLTAIFEDKPSAEKAIQSLEKFGIKEDDLTLLVASNAWNKEDDLKIVEGSKSAEGAALGAGIGGALGAVAAGLTGVGTIAATGGVGLLATGPLVAAMTGALIGGLVGLGYPEIEAKFVDEKLGRGSVMISVNVDEDRLKVTEDLLEEHNPERLTTH